MMHACNTLYAWPPLPSRDPVGFDLRREEQHQKDDEWLEAEVAAAVPCSGGVDVATDPLLAHALQRPKTHVDKFCCNLLCWYPFHHKGVKCGA